MIELDDSMFVTGALLSKPDVRDYVASCAAPAEAFPDEFELKLDAVKNQGSVGSCHDDQTEVLTRQGWKLFKDVLDTDLLASVNPANNQIIFEKPSVLISYPYAGEMIVGKHTSLDFKVTPNHKMLVRPWNERRRTLDDTYTLVDADKLGCYSGLMTTFNYQGVEAELDDSARIVFPEERLSNGNVLPELQINLHDWVQLVGIYLAEGTLCTDSKYYHYRIQLAAVKDREVRYIRDLLTRLGIVAANHKKDRFVFHNKRIWLKLAEYGLHGVKAADKFIPDFIFDLPSSYIKEFLLGFGMGDGHCDTAGRWQYFTSSPRLAEQLQIACLLAGQSNKIAIRPPRPAHFGRHYVPVENVKPSYIVSPRSKPLSITRKQAISTEFYEGTVYCATMPTYHTLITRRNGNILVSGNCVAHSLAETAEHFNLVQEGKSIPMSTAYIYGNRRNTTWKNSGMYVNEALDNLLKFGTVPKSVWPDNIEVPKAIDQFEAKCLELASQAYPYRISSYFRVTNESAIKSQLVNYGPVVFAITWWTNLKLDNNYCLTKSANSQTNGAHCMVIYGWNKYGWKVRNSWGSTWGNKGNFILPYEWPINESWGVTDDICTSATEKLLEEYKNKLAALEKESEQLKININYLNTKINELIAEKSELQDKIYELVDRQEYDDEELNLLRAQLEAKSIELEHMSEELQNITNQYNDSKKAEESFKKELDELRNKILDIKKPFENCPKILIVIFNLIVRIIKKLGSK